MYALLYNTLWLIIAKIQYRSPTSPLKYHINKNQYSYFITPSVPYEVSDVINTLKAGKSIGPNSIPIKLLTTLSLHVSSPLSQLNNESFLSGIFPEKMQLAKVTQLFTKGCPMIVSKYRPISPFSVFSKISQKNNVQAFIQFRGAP